MAREQTRGAALDQALEDRLLLDAQAAVRTGDTMRRDTLRMMRAALHYEEVARRGKLDEAAAFEVLQREVKKREEALELFR